MFVSLPDRPGARRERAFPTPGRRPYTAPDDRLPRRLALRLARRAPRRRGRRAGRPSRRCGACAPTTASSSPGRRPRCGAARMLAAWRLRARGLQPGDRLLTWSPSTPRLPAVYWGAMRAGVVIVPLDLRMTPGVIDRISARADTRWLAVDSGYDAPDPAEVGLDHFTVWKLEDLVADPDDDVPGRLGGAGRRLAGARPRLALRGRLHLWHDGRPEGRACSPTATSSRRSAAFGTLLEPRHHRAVSILPLSHLFEQAPVLFYATSIGAEVALRPLAQPAHHLRGAARAARDGHGPDAADPRALLERPHPRGRAARPDGAVRARPAHRPAPALPPAARSSSAASTRSSAASCTCSSRAGAYLPPELQLAWEDLGIVVIQGYGSTECGIVTANDQWRHPAGRRGPRARALRGAGCIPRPRRSSSRGPNVSAGYWRDEEATRGLARRGGLDR